MGRLSRSHVIVFRERGEGGVIALLQASLDQINSSDKPRDLRSRWTDTSCVTQEGGEEAEKDK